MRLLLAELFQLHKLRQDYAEVDKEAVPQNLAARAVQKLCKYLSPRVDVFCLTCAIGNTETNTESFARGIAVARTKTDQKPSPILW